MLSMEAGSLGKIGRRLLRLADTLEERCLPDVNATLQHLESLADETGRAHSELEECVSAGEAAMRDWVQFTPCASGMKDEPGESGKVARELFDFVGAFKTVPLAQAKELFDMDLSAISQRCLALMQASGRAEETDAAEKWAALWNIVTEARGIFTALPAALSEWQQRVGNLKEAVETLSQLMESVLFESTAERRAARALEKVEQTVREAAWQAAAAASSLLHSLQDTGGRADGAQEPIGQAALEAMAKELRSNASAVSDVAAGSELASFLEDVGIAHLFPAAASTALAVSAETVTAEVSEAPLSADLKDSSAAAKHESAPVADTANRVTLSPEALEKIKAMMSTFHVLGQVRNALGNPSDCHQMQLAVSKARRDDNVRQLSHSSEVLDTATAVQMGCVVESRGGAQGKTMGSLHLCLQWENTIEEKTDLDFIVTCPCGNKVCFSSKRIGPLCLDIDDRGRSDAIESLSVENIFSDPAVGQPLQGEYTVAVSHYKGPKVDYTVSVAFGGVLAKLFHKSSNEASREPQNLCAFTWDAATCTGSLKS